MLQIELTWFEEIFKEYKFEIKKRTISKTKKFDIMRHVLKYLTILYIQMSF